MKRLTKPLMIIIFVAFVIFPLYSFSQDLDKLGLFNKEYKIDTIVESLSPYFIKFSADTIVIKDCFGKINIHTKHDYPMAFLNDTGVAIYYKQYDQVCCKIREVQFNIYKIDSIEYIDLLDSKKHLLSNRINENFLKLIEELPESGNWATGNCGCFRGLHEKLIIKRDGIELLNFSSYLCTLNEVKNIDDNFQSISFLVEFFNELVPPREIVIK